MGVAYLGIGIGGMLVPQLAHALEAAFGWRTALMVLGVLMVVIAFPAAFFVREAETGGRTAGGEHALPREAARRGTPGWATCCAGRPSTSSRSAAWSRSARLAGRCRT